MKTIQEIVASVDEDWDGFGDRESQAKAWAYCLHAAREAGIQWEDLRFGHAGKSVAAFILAQAKRIHDLEHQLEGVEKMDDQERADLLNTIEELKVQVEQARESIPDTDSSFQWREVRQAWADVVDATLPMVGMSNAGTTPSVYAAALVKKIRHLVEAAAQATESERKAVVQADALGDQVDDLIRERDDLAATLAMVRFRLRFIDEPLAFLVEHEGEPVEPAKGTVHGRLLDELAAAQERADELKALAEKTHDLREDVLDALEPERKTERKGHLATADAESPCKQAVVVDVPKGRGYDFHAIDDEVA